MVTLLLALCTQALADEPIVLRERYEGTVDFVLAGTSLATDTDADGRADTLAQPAGFTVAAADVPVGSSLEAAWLYWGGTQPQPVGGACTGSPDDQVTLLPPAGGALVVTGDRCDCADGGSTGYDVWTCRADLASELSAVTLSGSWSVDDYVGQIDDGDTDHAAAGLVLVIEDPSLLPRTVALYDGLQTVFQDTLPLQLGGFEASPLARGDLGWMVLEGDPGGSPDEYVAVTGLPGGASGFLSDADNPADDPMNRTVNVASPVQTGVVGLDLDRFALDPYLADRDDTLQVELSADNDKYWPVVLIASVAVTSDRDADGVLDADDGCPDTFDPLQEDADGDGIGDACDDCPDEVGAGGADTDGDGVPDLCDACPQYDDRLDADGDTVPDACDQCPSQDDRDDADGDGVPDACDQCPFGDDTADSDGDGTADACDLCEDFDDRDDGDGDGVPDACDVCDPGDDRLDADGDGVPDACDQCPQGADDADADNDGTPDACDRCPQGDDTADSDNDGTPDACDLCELGDDDLDSDGDTVPDACDQCDPGDDRLDADGDTTPDACDLCLDGDDRDDADGDGVPDACDTCDGIVDGGVDSDGDRVPDACDLCPNEDDRLDADGDTIPDGCDVCPDFDDRVDNDGDKFPDACDTCPFVADPGQLDLDADGQGDACDPCPTSAFQADTDLDGSWSCVDCDDTDPALHALDDDNDGYTTCDGDCDDDDDRVFPGAGETPDGTDEDCDGAVDDETARYDDDGDGFAELGGDCDDANAGTHPGAAEVCDGIDQDCDGIADEGTDCYDDDGDGFCEAASCTDGSLPGDCNDSARSTHPAANEVQGNGIDDDCDGLVDDAVSDLDGDGVSADGGDCDDEDATVSPGQPELPDGLDNDCDGQVDEGTVRGDDDGDGWTELGGDCHDDDASVHPGADEPVDGIDNDCDGIVDDGSAGTDDDGDGFADAAGDCDDGDPSVFPGALESDNGRDDDCDGAVDEDFVDVDGDGVTYADGDCDDLEGWVNPGQAEVCDGLDNDCDGQADEDACDNGSGAARVTASGGSGGCSTTHGAGGAWAVLLAALWRRRQWAALPLLAGCSTETTFQGIQPRLAVTPSALLDFGDVPAGQSALRPVVIEHLEGADIELQQIVLIDGDGVFAYEGPEEALLLSGGELELPLRYLAPEPGWHTAMLEITHGGLDDQVTVDLRGHAVPTEAEVWPLGVDYGLVALGEAPVREITVTNRGGIALQIDELYLSSRRFEADLQLPRSISPGEALVVPVVFRPETDDPAGGELSIRAGGYSLAQVTLWANDCDGGLADAYDVDGDGISACATDCDDTDPFVRPGAQEKADGVDNDCDGSIDEGTTATDDDGDGACDDALFCIDGAVPGDCNDQDPQVGPHAIEILDNGIDDDCDGRVDFGIDDDDGDGVAVSGGDCDDLDPSVWPGADEAPNGIDDDCDGLIDEGTIQADDDGDGWCEGPACADGSTPGDCHDDDAAVFPGAVEDPNWLDDDCDGRVDEGTTHSDDDGDGFTEQGGDCDDDDPALSPALGTC